MAETGRIEKDQLFLGLTRPAMMLGVNYMWFMVNAMVCAIFFINTDGEEKFLAFPIALIMHAVGFVICSKEPRYMEIIITRANKCLKCKNSMFYGYTQSFDPY